MKKSLPIPPFPSVGEIVYECSIGSGLVRSNEAGGKLYADLKAFKDERKRPGLRPIEFPKYLLVDLEDRLAQYMGSCVAAFEIFRLVRKTLSWYAGCVAVEDATLLEREQAWDRVLWPSLFSSMAATLLVCCRKMFPVADPENLLADAAPFGRFLQVLCTQGNADYLAICKYRSDVHNIDLENCQKTLKTWLDGSAVPSLDSCEDILYALGLAQDPGVKLWTLTARFIARGQLEHRKLILQKLDSVRPSREPTAHFHELKNEVAWRIGESLNIGPDRPFVRLRAALYDASVPRDARSVEDMLHRLEKTWAPIAEKTQHTIDWFTGRYLALCGRYEEAFPLYVSSYEKGMGRDPDVIQHVLDEAIALAGRLGKWRAVEKFQGLVGLYWTTEWDGRRETLPAHFLRKFPPSLRFNK